MKLRSVVALLLAVMMLLSCASVAEGKTKVTIWHTFTKDQEAYLVQAAADFNACQDKYEVEVLSQAYSGFTDTVKTAVKNGVGPDIIFNYASEAAEYVDNGLVADLSQYIYDEEIGIEGFETSLAQGVMDGEVNGFSDGIIHYLPAYTTGPILFYNKTMYDELGLTVPANWDEMVANCKVIKEAKDIPGLGFDSLTDCIQMFIKEDGCGYIDVENKCVTFNTESMKAKIQWLVDCINAGYFTIASSGNYFSEDFNSGIVATYIGSCAGYPYIKPDGFDFAMAPMPATVWYPSWNRGPIAFYYDDDARAEGTYEFIKYFISAEVNLGWVKAVNALAPYSWTQELDAYKEYFAVDEETIESLENVVTHLDACINELKSYKDCISVENQTVQNVIENVDEKIKGLETCKNDIHSYVLAMQSLQAVAAHLDIAGSLPAVTGASTVRTAIVNAVKNVVNNGMTVEEAWNEAELLCNAALKGE